MVGETNINLCIYNVLPQERDGLANRKWLYNDGTVRNCTICYPLGMEVTTEGFCASKWTIAKGSS